MQQDQEPKLLGISLSDYSDDCLQADYRIANVSALFPTSSYFIESFLFRKGNEEEPLCHWIQAINDDVSYLENEETNTELNSGQSYICKARIGTMAYNELDIKKKMPICKFDDFVYSESYSREEKKKEPVCADKSDFPILYFTAACIAFIIVFATLDIIRIL